MPNKPRDYSSFKTVKLDECQVTDFIHAIEKFSENVGKRLWFINKTLENGLAAIALAASTPDDNSADVQAKLDALTAELKLEADALEGSAQPKQAATSDS